MNLLIISIMLLMTSNHTTISVLYLLNFCIIMLVLLKSNFLSVSILLIGILFISGILLLLFYLAIFDTNLIIWMDLYFMIIIFLVYPISYNFMNYKFSLLSSNMEFYYYNMEMLMYIILVFMGVFLCLISLFMEQMKWMRQVY